jgi:hypothetical protein
MFRRSITALIALVSLSIVKAEIDLSPAVREYTGEGAKFEQLTFTHGKQRIEYVLPRGWSFDGTRTELRLRPPKKAFAEAVIDAVPLSKSQLLEQNALRQQCLSSLPPGSQFVKVEQEMENAIPFDGNHSFEVIVSYQVIGETFLRSTLFLNLPDTQLIFRFTARKDDFEPLQREFRTSLGSWHWRESDDAAAQVGKTVTSTSDSKAP